MAQGNQLHWWQEEIDSAVARERVRSLESDATTSPAPRMGHSQTVGEAVEVVEVDAEDAEEALSAPVDIGEELEAEARARAAARLSGEAISLPFYVDKHATRERLRQEWKSLCRLAWIWGILFVTLQIAIHALFHGGGAFLVGFISTPMVLLTMNAAGRRWLEKLDGPVITLERAGIQVNTPAHPKGLFVDWKDIKEIKVNGRAPGQYLTIRTHSRKAIVLSSGFLPVDCETMAANVTSFRATYG